MTKVPSQTLIASLVMIILISLATESNTTTHYLGLMTLRPSQTEAALDVIEHSMWPPRSPKPLLEEERNQSVLLVHVGKAGGSSVRNLARTGKNKCLRSKNASIAVKFPRDIVKSLPFYCSLGRVTCARDVAHMWANQASSNYANYSQYLVPVRNPIDRLISWYKYELNMLFTNKLSRGSAPALVKLTENCSYYDADSLIMDGLVDPAVDGKTDKLDVDASQKFCQNLATDCLTGKKKCQAHNFYNYEVYLEDLIRWRGECVEETHNACNATTGERREIRIDVLRSEHSESDWKRILELWTGETNITGTPVLQALKGKANTASKLNVNSTDQVRQEGIERLCRSICVELVAYKKVIALADNLLDAEVEQSYRELDERCGFSVDDTCGTEFHYRNSKRFKRIA